MKIKNLILLFCLSATISLFAQDEPEPEPEPTPVPTKVSSKPYKKSFGIVAGNLLGLSYKYVSPYKKFAYQMDFGEIYLC